MNRNLFYVGFAASMILFIAVLCGLVLASAGWNNYVYKSDAPWTAWVFKQKKKLLAGPGSRRLVIVSGSNGLFGISASELTHLTSYDTINAATHAGLPFEFIDLEMMSELREGDTVLLPLESGVYYSTNTLSSLVVQVAHQVNLEFFSSLNLLQRLIYLRMLDHAFVIDQYKQGLSQAVERKRFERISKFGYWQLGVSDRGDVDLSKATSKKQAVIRGAKNYEKISNHTELFDVKAPILCSSIRRLSDRGVRVLGTPDNVYMTSESLIAERRDVLGRAQALFQGCGGHWLAIPNDGLQPLDRMLDTPYHLNQEGRQQRTAELAQALCQTALKCQTEVFPKGD